MQIFVCREGDKPLLSSGSPTIQYVGSEDLATVVQRYTSLTRGSALSAFKRPYSPCAWLPQQVGSTDMHSPLTCCTQWNKLAFEDIFAYTV